MAEPSREDPKYSGDRFVPTGETPRRIPIPREELPGESTFKPMLHNMGVHSVFAPPGTLAANSTGIAQNLVVRFKSGAIIRHNASLSTYCVLKSGPHQAIAIATARITFPALELLKPGTLIEDDIGEVWAVIATLEDHAIAVTTVTIHNPYEWSIVSEQEILPAGEVQIIEPKGWKVISREATA